MDINLSTLFDYKALRIGIEQNKEGFAIHDSLGKLTYINPAMATMFGYSIDEVLGQPWHLFYDDVQVAKISSLCLSALSKQDHWQGILTGRKKKGSLFNINISLTVLKNNKGSSFGHISSCQDISRSTQINKQLITQKQQYELIFNHSPLLIANVGSDYRYKVVNKQYCEWLGKPRDTIIGFHVQDVLSEVAFNLVKKNIDRVLQGQEINFETKTPDSTGLQKWVNATYIPQIDQNGVVIGLFAFILDIDEKKQQEFNSQNLMQAIERGIEGFSLHEIDGNFIYVNPAEASMYGYETQELIGQSWKKLYSVDQVSDIETNYLPILKSEGQWRGELIGLKKNGDLFDVEVSLTLLKNEAGMETGLFCACRDISERKRSQGLVDFLAYHDSLTGLPNRLFFKERLDHSLVRAFRRDTIVAVLFIDLDFFKHVNDILGHSIGDKLLQSVAARIKSVFRDEDTVARISGDEFTVILCDINERNPIEAILDKLISSFNEPINVEGRELHQSISVGVSMYPQDGQDVETLMKNADAAMYQAKEEGRQGYRFYVPSLTNSLNDSILYRAQLKKALDRSEFVLYYQPIISLTENRIIGFEALIRWQHPEQGLVYPDKFIRYAEESNLIVPIGIWVLEKACLQLNEWKNSGISIDRLSINISGVQLQTELTSKISEILNKTKTPHEAIELEITETFLMKGLKKPVSQLEQLRSLGIQLSIDDFGVGYSSLSQLKRLPTQGLKIDRSFIKDIAYDTDDLAIVEAVIALGKILKLEITAEGVETVAQHELLKKLDCQKAQGYYFAKPCQAKEIPALYQKLNARLKNT